MTCNTDKDEEVISEFITPSISDIVDMNVNEEMVIFRESEADRDDNRAIKNFEFESRKDESYQKEIQNDNVSDNLRVSGHWESDYIDFKEFICKKISDLNNTIQIHDAAINYDYEREPQPTGRNIQFT